MATFGQRPEWRPDPDNLGERKMLRANRAEHVMPKAALLMISKLFAARLADARIAVYELRPGINRTDMTLPATRKYDALIASDAVPAKRRRELSDVAETVAALASRAPTLTISAHAGVGCHLNRL